MGDKPDPTVRLKRPPRITSDGRGRSVWAEPVETVELELVSTQTLKTLLETADDKSRAAIEEVARSAQDGVLARDPTSGSFEIIDENDLKSILDDRFDLPKLRRPVDATLDREDMTVDEGDALSLVSTQALRKILGQDDAPKPLPKARRRDDGGGFDPYNNG